MSKQDKEKALSAPVRDAVKTVVAQDKTPRSAVRSTAMGACEDCRATTAFQAWHSVDLTPSFNVEVSFADWKIVPKGKRAVIELVTAQIIVPSGEWARLRMYTSLGSVPSNLDLFLTFQGNVEGNAVYDATHSLRAYTDNLIDFDINRDNATTTGSALICISGYIVG
ncbi:MAG: hypothetical protein WBW33_23525 [Bryobacteraceae bacterium]